MKRAIRILLSVLSGVGLSLAWLGLPGWILLIAFVPLLYLEHFFTENKQDYSGISFWGHAFLTFFIWNGLSTWWIFHATSIGAVMAVLVNAFLMSLVFWLAHYARRNMKSNLGYFALIVFWISFEFFHFKWDIQWPWLTLGNGFANTIKLIQWYEFTGVLGGSLWILWVNILLLKLFLKFWNTRRFNRDILVPVPELLLVVTIPIIISTRIYSGYTEKGNPINIVLVQPNVNPYAENYTQEAEDEKIRSFVELAKTVANTNTGFVVGPETVVENYFAWDEDKLDENLQFKKLKDFLLEFPNTELIFGASTSRFYPDENQASETARFKNGKIYDVFNSAILLNSAGETQIYHKSILVSGVEKVPFSKYLGFMKDWYFDLGGASGNLGSSNESVVFVSGKGLKITPVICFESVFGEYVAGSALQGAEIIFIITNDGWWKNTPGYKQHLSFARLRAIETRRSVARAANTGISCFINQKGELLQSTQWNKKTAISGTLNTNTEITFYMKTGDYIARVALFSGVLMVLFLLTERLRKNIKKPH